MTVLEALTKVETESAVHRFVLHDAVNIKQDKLAELRKAFNSNGLTSAKMTEALGQYTLISIELDSVHFVELYAKHLSAITASVIGFSAGFGLHLELADAYAMHNTYYYNTDTKTMDIYSENYWTYMLGTEL